MRNNSIYPFFGMLALSAVGFVAVVTTNSSLIKMIKQKAVTHCLDMAKVVTDEGGNQTVTEEDGKEIDTNWLVHRPGVDEKLYENCMLRKGYSAN